MTKRKWAQSLFPTRRLFVSHSISQQMEIACPKCSNKFAADIWLVIDVWERPDLVELLQRGVLHLLTCPSCSKQIAVDTPLLVYRPYAEPPFFLSVPPDTKKKKTRYYASTLLSQLRDSMAGEWDDAWVADRSVKVLDRAELRVTMNLDMVLIGRQMIDREEREAAFERGEMAPELKALSELLEADTWADARRLVELHPDLLNDTVDKLLEELITATYQRADNETGRHLCTEPTVSAALPRGRTRDRRERVRRPPKHRPGAAIAGPYLIQAHPSLLSASVMSRRSRSRDQDPGSSIKLRSPRTRMFISAHDSIESSMHATAAVGIAIA